MATQEKLPSDRVSGVRQEARSHYDATHPMIDGSMALKPRCAGGLTNAEADER